MMNVFQRNALRLKLLVVVIITTVLLALYKTLLGGYLMGLNLTVSALYRSSSMFSLVTFSVVGFAVFYRIIKPFQVFYNHAVRGEAVSPELFQKAARISKTVARFAFSINFVFYTFSSILMYFLNYYGRVESFWLGVRYGVFNFTTNFATAFMAALLQVTFIDYMIDKYKKQLKIHFMKTERELKIRTRLLLFTAATIVYLLSFIALPAFNKLEAEKNIKAEVGNALLSDMSKEEIYAAYHNALAQDGTREYTFYTAIISAGLTVIIMGSAFLIFLEFNRRLADIRTSLDELTKGEGDLSRRLVITKFDEIGLLMNNFNRFMQFLSELVLRVKKTIFEVKGATEELAASLGAANAEIEAMMGETAVVQRTLEEQNAMTETTTGNLDRTLSSIESIRAKIGDQAAVVEQNSASITEITANIHQVHDNTEQAMKITGDLENSSVKGSEAVNDTIEAITDIAAFSQEVKEAGEIISAIADQTSILAMNASIEAAHAGNYGRGFAVVADEIRKLAESASQSASEILSTIHSMDEKIGRTVELARLSGNSLESIFEGVKRSAALVTQITQSMSEQSAGANEIQNSFMHLLSATEDLKTFIMSQAETSDVMKIQMGRFITHAETMRASMETLSARDNAVKTEVARIMSISSRNNALVGELFERIKKFNVEDGQAASTET